VIVEIAIVQERLVPIAVDFIQPKLELPRSEFMILPIIPPASMEA
jgi:hypothetical protein